MYFGRAVTLQKSRQATVIKVSGFDVDDCPLFALNRLRPKLITNLITGIAQCSHDYKFKVLFFCIAFGTESSL